MGQFLIVSLIFSNLTIAFSVMAGPRVNISHGVMLTPDVHGTIVTADRVITGIRYDPILIIAALYRSDD